MIVNLTLNLSVPAAIILGAALLSGRRRKSWAKLGRQLLRLGKS